MGRRGWMIGALAMLAGVLAVQALREGAARSDDGDDVRRSSRAGAMPVAAGPSLVVPALRGAQAPLVLPRRLMEDAVASGRLQVRDASVGAYQVGIERTESTPGGHWTVVGRVATSVGTQPMVLTFGPDAAFGVLPRPDGQAYLISTTRGGLTIAQAGDMARSSAGGHRFEDVDYVVPPAAGLPDSAALHVERVANAERKSATGEPVEIVVLALYTGDLVVLRGSVAAAETEMANLFARANQSHLDSGTGVQFRVAAMREVAVDPARNNRTVLDDITYDRIEGTELVRLRDAQAADLVALVRPYRPAHGSCGVAWLGGGELSSAYISDAFGFSVTNVDGGCGAHVLAHELGHNLGSAHDRATQTGQDGRVSYGAYAFSFGYRQSGPPSFATVMAYTAFGQPWVGYFSSPDSTRCGARCGVADAADNVRSQRYMAPLVASFRGPPGTLSISDAAGFEPDSGQDISINVRVRLSGPAPSGGVRFYLAVDGTATPGRDVGTFPTSNLLIPEGAREHTLRIPLIGDELIEGDETLRLRLVDVSGAPVHDAVADVVILDDDPRLPVTGRVRFPPGAAPPSGPLRLWTRGLHGDSLWTSTQLQGPGFAYRLPAVRGSIVQAYLELPPPFAMLPVDLPEVRRPMEFDLPVVQGVRVTGDLLMPPGAAPWSDRIYLTFAAFRYGGASQLLPAQVLAKPDYRYEAWVVPGATLRIELSPPAPYARFLARHSEVESELRQDVIVSGLPTMNLTANPVVMERSAGAIDYASLTIELSAPAPEGGARVRYFTESGTATADRDFVAATGVIEFAPGERSRSLSVRVDGDDVIEGAETFRVRLRDADGAQLVTDAFRFTIREPDVYMSRPLPPVPAD